MWKSGACGDPSIVNDEEQPVEVGDETPSIREQAAKRGWACDYFDFGRAETLGVEFFNPGLVRRPDGLWLLVRRSEVTPGMWYGRNAIWACKLDENKKPLGGPMLQFPNSKVDEQFEDPRAVFWNNQTWIGCVNFTWFTNGSWTGAHQMIGVFQDKGGSDITDETWHPLVRRDPIIGTNRGTAGHTHGKHNKNLLWWFIDGKLHCLYTSDPWNVVQFGNKWEEQIPYVADGVIWKYGVVRGGTPPVRAGDFFYTFFHSSLPWRGRYRRYHMGAIAFETSPPFRPVFWTQEPILSGSQNDPWAQKKPLVVFPCGAVLENGKWLISLGVNDLKSAWIEIPHDDLTRLLKPIPVVPGLSLLSNVTPTPEYPAIPYEDLSSSTEGRATGGKSDEGPVPNEAVTHHRQCEPAGTKEQTAEVSTQETCIPCDGLTRTGLQTGAEYRSEQPGESAPTTVSENQGSPAQSLPVKRKRGRPRKVR